MNTTATPSTTQPTVTMLGEWDDDVIVSVLVRVVVKRVREMEEHDAEIKRETGRAMPVRVRK